MFAGGWTGCCSGILRQALASRAEELHYHPPHQARSGSGQPQCGRGSPRVAHITTDAVTRPEREWTLPDALPGVRFAYLALGDFQIEVPRLRRSQRLPTRTQAGQRT